MVNKIKLRDSDPTDALSLDDMIALVGDEGIDKQKAATRLQQLDTLSVSTLERSMRRGNTQAAIYVNRSIHNRGADHTINYNDKDIASEVRRLTGGLGVDIALDMVGGNVFLQTIDALAPGARLVTVGAHGGEKVKLDMIELFRKHISVYGCGRSTRAIAEQVLGLVAVGKLTPVIHAKFKLRDAAQAHDVMESRKFFGRMVLNP